MSAIAASGPLVCSQNAPKPKPSSTSQNVIRSPSSAADPPPQAFLPSPSDIAPCPVIHATIHYPTRF
ncbi:hypothetical protein FKP32DRAFT_1671470 [Trametes sanguinea]|nr:hypothetical protein FKP32DRAFT_1671470 [Trametes sanguinea]